MLHVKYNSKTMWKKHLLKSPFKCMLNERESKQMKVKQLLKLNVYVTMFLIRRLQHLDNYGIFLKKMLTVISGV